MHARDLALGRMRVLDAKPVNLDGFSVTNPELGLVAMRSPHDPEPSLVVRDGAVAELDGKAAGLRRHRRVHRALRIRSRRRAGGHGARRCGVGPDDGGRQCVTGRGGAPDRWHHARQTGPRRRAAHAGRDADGDEQDARQENAGQPGPRHQSARRSTAHRRRRGQRRRVRLPGGRDHGASAWRCAVQCGRPADRQPGRCAGAMAQCSIEEALECGSACVA